MLTAELKSKIQQAKQSGDLSGIFPFAKEASETEKAVARIMLDNPDAVLVADVGDNMYITARAYADAKADNQLLYSKNFAPLGCSVPKAIGAYYATRKPVLCFVGDQGLLFNIQELHYIAQQKLPIAIVLLNNRRSGMIARAELQRGLPPLHTTPDSGYAPPDYQKLAEAFGVEIKEIAYEQ